MQRSHLLRISLPLLAVIIFTNCTENVDRPECLPDESNAVVRSSSDTNESGPVAVFADASGTMRGYVSARAQAEAETPYANLIRTLPDLLSVPETDRSYFAFGVNTQPINQRQFLRATALSFYNNKLLNQFSRINLAFEAASSADPGVLTLVITDLFLSGNELVTGAEGPLRRPLAQALRQGKTVGILAMLSPFAGHIHDMPDNPSQPINFEGQRPFYLVMIGPEERITALYKRLESDVLRHIPEANHHFILFTSDMVGDLEPLDRERPAKNTDVIGPGVIKRTNVLAKGLKIPQYIVDRSVRTHVLRITVPLAPVKVPPRPGFEQIVVREQVYRFRRKPHNECSHSWERVEVLGGSMTSVDKPAGTDSATVALFDDPQVVSGLPHGSVFIVDITLVATAVKHHGDAVDWMRMQNWSFSASEAPQIRKNPPDPFPTLNLALLSDVMLDIISERYKEEPVAQMRLAFRID